jgi:HK97 family phage major capsid protein
MTTDYEMEKAIARISENNRQFVEDKFDVLDRELARIKSPQLKFMDTDGPKSPESKAWSNFLRKGIVPNGIDTKALLVSDGPQAGFLAPGAFSRQLIEIITEFSPIRKAGATVLQTDKESLTILKKASIGVAKWVGETETRTETVNPIFGLEKITPHEMYRLILASNQMLEDSYISFEEMLVKDAAQSFAVLEGAGFLTGTGVGNEPEGLLVNATLEAAKVKSGSDTTVLADNLIAVPDQLKSGYLTNAKWLMHRNTWAKIKLLKAPTSNMYLFEPNLGVAVPNRLLGFDVILTPDMDSSLAAGDDCIVFGDFSGYTVVDRIQTQVVRLDQKYQEYGEIGFIFRRRVGGQVTNPEALVKVYCAT